MPFASSSSFSFLNGFSLYRPPCECACAAQHDALVTGCVRHGVLPVCIEIRACSSSHDAAPFCPSTTALSIQNDTHAQASNLSRSIQGETRRLCYRLIILNSHMVHALFSMIYRSPSLLAKSRADRYQWSRKEFSAQDHWWLSRCRSWQYQAPEDVWLSLAGCRSRDANRCGQYGSQFHLQRHRSGYGDYDLREAFDGYRRSGK